MSNNELKKDENHFENIYSIALYGNNKYIFKNDSIYDYNDNLIYNGNTGNAVNSLYCFDDKLAIATKTGLIYFYDLKLKTIYGAIVKFALQNGGAIVKNPIPICVRACTYTRTHD